MGEGPRHARRGPCFYQAAAKKGKDAFQANEGNGNTPLDFQAVANDCPEDGVKPLFFPLLKTPFRQPFRVSCQTNRFVIAPAQIFVI